MRGNGMISYMPFGKEQPISVDGGWANKGRQEIKPAKFARSFLNERISAKIPDHIFADFATNIKAHDVENTITFKIVPFQEAYYGSKYPLNVKTCMTNKRVHLMYNMFDCCALVAEDTTGKLVGRTILWNDVYIEPMTFDGKPRESYRCKFMDRIYYKNEEILQLFKYYAEANDFYRKVSQGSGSYDLVKPDGTLMDSPLMMVEAKFPRTEKGRMFYPYMDTFSYGTINGKLLTNRYNAFVNTHKHYSNTDGTRDTEMDSMTAVPLGGTEDKWAMVNDCVIIGNRYHLKSGNTLCQINEKYYAKTDPRVVSVNNKYYLKKDTVTVRGKNYLKTDKRLVKGKTKGTWKLQKIVKVHSEPIVKVVKVDSEPIDTTTSTERYVKCVFDEIELALTHPIGYNNQLTQQL
jgi:hypothetical protein